MTVELSERELQVLQLLVDGYTDKAIAAALGIGIRTSDTHIENIQRKLCIEQEYELDGVPVNFKATNMRVRAAVEAVRRGLVK